jgi:O-succinylbenzoic acid--CoA ligase
VGPAGSGEALLTAARDRVAAAVGPVARPGRILFVAALPQLASGKPDRRALAALANAG